MTLVSLSLPLYIYANDILSCIFLVLVTATRSFENLNVTVHNLQLFRNDNYRARRVFEFEIVLIPPQVLQLRSVPIFLLLRSSRVYLPLFLENIRYKSIANVFDAYAPEKLVVDFIFTVCQISTTLETS